MQRLETECPEPLLSVVICTLNEEENIRRTVRAVLDNVADFPSFEIIVADSGSDDTTEAEVYKAQRDAARFGIKLSLIKAPVRGVSIARNTGASIAEGKHLFFLDADTTIDDKFLRRNLERMEKRKLAVGGIYMKPDSGELIDEVLVGSVNKFLHMAQRTPRAGAFGAALFFERSVFHQMHGFDPDIKLGEDIDLVRRTVKAAYSFEMLPDSVVTSARRAEMEGRLSLLIRTLRLAIYFARHDTTKGANIKYDFGHFNKNK